MLYSRRKGNTITAVNANYEANINSVSAAGRPHPTTGAATRRPARGAAARRPRARTRMTETSATITLHTATRRGSASPGASGSRETGQPPRTTLGGGMIFLQDDESKQQFRVDTGAVCSVLPHRLKTSPTGPQLSGADGKAIPWWGSVCHSLTFGLRTFFVPFLLAAVYRPILGLDFLFLALFPAIIGNWKGKPSPKHRIRHTIEMTGRPVFAKARRLDPDRSKGVLQQLNGGSWQPLAFYSKKLSGVGTRYSIFNRELLAAFSAVRHF
jgi:hypothetical protein